MLITYDITVAVDITHFLQNYVQNYVKKKGVVSQNDKNITQHINSTSFLGHNQLIKLPVHRYPTSLLIHM